jgi:hypothetical protein
MIGEIRRRSPNPILAPVPLPLLDRASIIYIPQIAAVIANPISQGVDFLAPSKEIIIDGKLTIAI